MNKSKNIEFRTEKAGFSCGQALFFGIVGFLYILSTSTVSNAASHTRLYRKSLSKQLPSYSKPARLNTVPLVPATSLKGQSTLIKKMPNLGEEKKSSAVGFSGKLSINNLQSMVDHQDGSKKNMTQIVAIANLDFTEYGSLGLTMIYDRMNKEPQKSDFEDSELRFSWNPYHVSISRDWDVDFTPDIGVALPTARDSFENQEMQAAGIAEGTFSFTSKKSVIQQSYSLGIEAYRYFHKYDVAVDGTGNIQWVLDKTLSAKWSYGMFSLFTSFIHFDTWTYSGNADGLFRHKEGIGINPTKNIGFQVGHTNSGNVFRENGYSNNVKLYDEESSLYFVKLILSI